MSDSTGSDGGQAFPCSFPEMGGGMMPGMTLRDWFAGQALTGLLACNNTVGEKNEFAREAYGYAYAMLEAREGCAR